MIILSNMITYDLDSFIKLKLRYIKLINIYKYVPFQFNLTYGRFQQRKAQL